MPVEMGTKRVESLVIRGRDGGRRELIVEASSWRLGPFPIQAGRKTG